MKYIVIFPILMAVFSSVAAEFVDDFMERVENMAKQCVAETGASDNDMKNLMGKSLPDTQEGKCLLFCMGKSFGVLQGDGSIILEKTLENIKPLEKENAEVYGKLKQLLEDCAKEVAIDASDPCQTSYNHMECHLKHAKDMGITEYLALD